MTKQSPRHHMRGRSAEGVRITADLPAAGWRRKQAHCGDAPGEAPEFPGQGD